MSHLIVVRRQQDGLRGAAHIRPDSEEQAVSVHRETARQRRQHILRSRRLPQSRQILQDGTRPGIQYTVSDMRSTAVVVFFRCLLHCMYSSISMD